MSKKEVGIEINVKDVKIGMKFSMLTVLGKKVENRDGHSRTYITCKCDCGKVKDVVWWSIKSGNTLSCGCLKNSSFIRRNTKKEGESAFNNLFYNYKKGAEARNLEFQLSIEDFKKLTSENCYYCGISPCNTTKRDRSNGNYVYNGIDRVDNLIGYTLDNCVPCCKQCNVMKLSLPLDSFIEKIEMIYNHFIKTKK